MSLGIQNDQFKQFAQFAENRIRAGKDSAVARFAAPTNGPQAPDGAGSLASRRIQAATEDWVGKIWRSNLSEGANEEVRTLFRKSVADIFGGNEDRIPQSVWDAMKLEDFGQGKPLTARRIMAVKEAVEAFAQEHADKNKELTDNISDNNFDRLPQPVREKLEYLVVNLRKVFGEAVVPKDAKITDLVNLALVERGLVDVRNRADGDLRDIDPSEVAAVFSKNAWKMLATKVAGTAILEKVKKLAPGIDCNPLALATKFNARQSGLLDDIYASKNPDDVAAAIRKYETDIDAFAAAFARTRSAADGAVAKAQGLLAKELGLDARFVGEHVPTDSLASAAEELFGRIMDGTEPGSRDAGYNVEAAFDRIVDNFVKERVDAWKAIESLNDLPKVAKDYWKSMYLSEIEMPKITPAQLLAAVDAIDVGKFESALSKGMPSDVAVAQIRNIVDKIDRATIKDIFDKTGHKASSEESVLLYSLVIRAAVAKNQKLSAAIVNAGKDNLLSSIGDRCGAIIQKDQDGGQYSQTFFFLQSLTAMFNARETSPLADETKFLAFAEKEIDAGLKDAGATDAKVSADVKEAILANVKSVLAKATSLGELDALAAGIRDRAAALAETLGMIRNIRNHAPSVAATMVSVSTGISKAYVMHNLDMNNISSDSGELSSLYKDVMDKEKNGKRIDHAAVRSKTNGIVPKFANAKAAFLKELDNAGLSPTECASLKQTVLSNPGMTDWSVVTLAKKIAADATMKTAANQLADTLCAKDCADEVLRKGFLLFGNTFLNVLQSEKLKADSQKVVDDADLLKLLQNIVVQLLMKDHTDVAESLAELGGNGKLDKLIDTLAKEINALQARKTDYLVANAFIGIMTRDVPRASTLPAAKLKTAKVKYIALQKKKNAIIGKYAPQLSQETLPLLGRLVNVLDWRDKKAARSEKVVADYVEDMKTWRDFLPGSNVAQDIEKILGPRQNNYFQKSLDGKTDMTFEKKERSGVKYPEVFIDDLPRANYVINGKIVPGETTDEKLKRFEDAIKDPAKRRAVAALANQQMPGELLSCVVNRTPLPPEEGGNEVETKDIPGIDVFATRDVYKNGGFTHLQDGSLKISIDVPEGENTVTVSCQTDKVIMAGEEAEGAKIGTCLFTIKAVIDFTGGKPKISDYTIGQALS